jgi:hypothetical protein
MEANNYRDYMDQKRRDMRRIKQMETDNLYNENTYGGNVWRNTKKFAALAIPALTLNHVIKNYKPGQGVAKTTWDAMIGSAGAIIPTAMASVAGVVPYTFLRQAEAENRQRDEGYEQFKHMQNKVLADNDLLVYQAPPRKTSPLLTPFDYESKYSPAVPRITQRDYSVRTSGGPAAHATQTYNIGEKIHRANELNLTKTRYAAENMSDAVANPKGLSDGFKLMGAGALISAAEGAVKKIPLYGPKLHEKISTPTKGAYMSEMYELAEELKLEKCSDYEKYSLMLERALDTLDEEKKQELLNLIKPHSYLQDLLDLANKDFAIEKTDGPLGKPTPLEGETQSDPKHNVFDKEKPKSNDELIKTVDKTKTTQTPNGQTTSVQTSYSVDFDDSNDNKTTTTSSTTTGTTNSSSSNNSGSSGGTQQQPQQNNDNNGGDSGSSKKGSWGEEIGKALKGAVSGFDKDTAKSVGNSIKTAGLSYAAGKAIEAVSNKKSSQRIIN